MGIKLKELIQSKSLEIFEIKGKRIAIDGMNMLFQLLKNPYSQQQQIEYYDSTQRPISHLYGWLQKIKAFQKYKLDIVVVFDGKPEDLKRIITKDFARDFLAMKLKYEQAISEGRKEEARFWANSPSYRWQNTIYESKRLLETCGIPVITAPSEAEAQCAIMQRDGIVDYIVSWDFDAMLFGATKILRSLTFGGRRNVNGKWQNFTPQISFIDVDTELSRLGLTRYQLIDLGVLVGNDYFPGIPQLGSKRAYEAIRYYGSIEAMIAMHSKLFSSLPIQKLNELRKLFFNPSVRKFSTFPDRPNPNPNALTQLLLEEHTLSPVKVEKYLKLADIHTQIQKKIHIFNDHGLGFIPASMRKG